LGAVALLLVAGKLSVRSVATGASVLPGIAGAPILGPADTPTATPGPPRVQLRVNVTDSTGRPVPQALVEVRDRFNAVVASQETSFLGDALTTVPLGSGYTVTARKQGFSQSRVDGVDASQAVPFPTPTPNGDESQPRRIFRALQGPTIRVQLQPAAASAAAAPARLVVGHSQARLSLLDAASSLLLKHSEPLGRNRPTLMAAAKDAGRLFATWSGSTDLLVLSAADLSLERQITVTAGAITSLAVDPKGGRVWVAATTPDVADASTLFELDPAAERVLRTLPVTQVVSSMRFAPEGNVLYVPNRSASVLSMVDPATATVVRTVRLPQPPTDLAVSPDGGSLYAVNLSADRLIELSAATGELLRSVEIGAGATAVIPHPDGRRAFVVNQLLGYVQVVDLAAGQVSDIVPVGAAPQGATLTPDGTALYVANVRSGTISVIDLAQRTVKETITIGGTPSSLLMLAPGA
jgi:YVTN family beta-propeller protein